MIRNNRLAAAGVLAATVAMSCAKGALGGGDTDGAVLAVGEAAIDFTIPAGVASWVQYQVAGGAFTLNGALDVSAPGTTAGTVLISSLSPGSYTVSIGANLTRTSCSGVAPFTVVAGQTARAHVDIKCLSTGSGERIDQCPLISGVAATSLAGVVGDPPIKLSVAAQDLDPGDAVTYSWTSFPERVGTLAPSGATALFTCTGAGHATVSISVSDGTCGDTRTDAFTIACSPATVVVDACTATETDPPPALAMGCGACLLENYNPLLDGCCGITDAVGFSLCNTASACIRAGGPPVGACNVGGETTSCFCGTNIATCESAANGPCVAQMTAAAGRDVVTGTTDSPTAMQVLSRLGDPNYALGRAANIQTIAAAFCPSQCGF